LLFHNLLVFAGNRRAILRVSLELSSGFLMFLSNTGAKAVYRKNASKSKVCISEFTRRARSFHALRVNLTLRQEVIHIKL
jgi:hypothetical protein